MKLAIRGASWALLFAIALPSFGFAQSQAEKLLRKYCYDCHGGNETYEFDILAPDQLDEDYVIKGSLDDSYLWQRIADQEMPPDDAPQPTAAELQVIKQWVLDGAPIAAAPSQASGMQPPESKPKPASARPPVAGGDLAREGQRILRDHCFSCHGGTKRLGNSAFDVSDPDSFQIEYDGVKYLEPGDPDRSAIWIRIANDSMPPRGAISRKQAVAVSPQDREILKQWIAAGGGFPGSVPRGEFVTEPAVWSLAENDLRAARESDRPFLRYLSLANVYNNYVRYSDQDFRAHQAAVSKTLNSLSWENRVALPQRVDQNGILWRIDLRSYGWDSMEFPRAGVPRYSAWKLLLQRYPFAISFDGHDDSRVRESYLETIRLSQSRMPIIRGDWFVFHATQGALYYLIAQVPPRTEQLESTLAVDVKNDFLDRKLLRAALTNSGVSIGNRLMDRHDSQFGYYWKSYDFGLNSQRGNLGLLPLGPEFDNNPHNQFAFEHDGGEMIFSLPNGMQGYMLTDGIGNRLEKGPSNVVSDGQGTTGTNEVVNAISCMNCHAAGMRVFDDTIRQAIAVQGDARRFALDLFDPKQRLRDQLGQDQSTYRRASDACFAVVESPPDSYYVPSTEPVSIVASKYWSSVNALDAAIEMGIFNREPDVTAQTLASQVAANSRLQNSGLAAFASGGDMRREDWENAMQDVVSEFGVGSSRDCTTSDASKIFRAYQQGKER